MLQRNICIVNLNPSLSSSLSGIILLPTLCPINIKLEEEKRSWIYCNKIILTWHKYFWDANQCGQTFEHLSTLERKLSVTAVQTDIKKIRE